MVKKCIILIYTSQREVLLNRATEILSRAGLALVAPRLSLDLLTAAKWFYQSLLPSPEVSGEGAAFPEVSDGKTVVCQGDSERFSQNPAWSGGSDSPPGLGIENSKKNLLWSISMSFIKLSRS